MTLYSLVFRKGRIGGSIGGVMVLFVFWLMAFEENSKSAEPAIAMVASTVFATIGIIVGAAIGAYLSKSTEDSDSV